MILFCHGLGEHIGRYSVLIDYFNDRGYACAGSDHYGHGKSPGKRGDIAAYRFFLDEIDEMKTVVKTHYPGIPLILYGHSMGGNIVLNYLVNRTTDDIHAAIASSPWITLPAKVPAAKQWLANVMFHLYPSFTAPNGLDPNGISHDSQIVREYIDDTLVHDKISVRLYRMMSENGQALLADPEILHTPTLLIHGTADPMTSCKGSEAFARQNKQAEYVAFPGMYHELHHEIIQDQVLETVGNWLNSQRR